MYSEDNERSSIEPVVRFKMVLFPHLYGLLSLPRTVKEISSGSIYYLVLGVHRAEREKYLSDLSLFKRQNKQKTYTFSKDGGMRVQLEYYRYLLEIDRCRSISEAARTLGLRQTTLSYIIKSIEQELGFSVFGGVNAPYIWLKTPGKLTSWEFFDILLNEANVVGTPGVGFGPSGEGYFRLTAFGSRENTVEAVRRIKKLSF